MRSEPLAREELRRPRSSPEMIPDGAASRAYRCVCMEGRAGAPRPPAASSTCSGGWIWMGMAVWLWCSEQRWRRRAMMDSVMQGTGQRAERAYEQLTLTRVRWR